LFVGIFFLVSDKQLEIMVMNLVGNTPS